MNMSWLLGVSSFSLLGLLIDLCLFVQSLLHSLNKTEDDLRHHYEFSILFYVLGFVSTVVFERKIFFGLLVLLICVSVHIFFRLLSRALSFVVRHR